MARRSNFIEGNDNFREQNLRFVRNEFEDNINQFFGGANPGGGGSQQKPPPRDSLIVQPTPGGPPDHSEPGRNLELDTRRQFIRDLGASRMTAHALAVRSFKVPDFNLRFFQRQRFRLSVELGDSRQNVVDAEVLRAIGEALENREADLESRPRTPSPPRNIDWHNVNRDDESPVRNDNRSRPRNRQGVDDFRGARDNSRGFVDQPEREREPYNRNTGPKNAPNNRYNRNSNPDEFNRNNRMANPQEINRNNRNANPQEFNRYNQNSDEFNRNNRNSDEFNRNNRNPNPQQEFHRGNHNANPQMEFNRNIPNENPQINRNNRNVNPEINRNNRNVNPQNRNPIPQEVYRNNRNPSNDEFNRNDNRPEIIRNNRNANPQQFNRNPQDFNRNMNPQGNRNPQLNPREGPQNFNRNANPREMPQNYHNPRFNNNNNNRGPGNNDFIPNEQRNLARNSMIDQRRDIDDNFLESRDRPALPPHSDFRQLQPQLPGNPGPPQIGRNYQRIVNNNQITICRADWIEAKRRELENRNQDNFGPNNRNLNDDDDRFHRPQPDTFRRPGFRGPEDPLIIRNQDDYNHSFEGNSGNFRNLSRNDPNVHGRDQRNDRNFDGNRRQFNDRSRSNDSGTFRGSPDRYDRRSGPGDRYQRDHSPQRANQGRNAPNPRQPSTSLDRTMARNNNSSGRNPRSTSKVSQERNPVGPKQPRTNPDRNPRSTSLASLSRSTSGGPKPSQDRSVSGNKKPGDANLKKPMGPGQRKPLIKPSEAKNTNAGASKALAANQPRKNAPTAIAGQKRKAETRESSSNRSTKVEIKRKKLTASQPAFIIGGNRLPYINNLKKKLPQSEDKSYAVTFFEQTPIYNTNIYAIDDGQTDNADEEEDSEAESVDSNQSGAKKNKPNLKKKIRNKLRKEWMAIYRENNYKDWYTWWKDYNWCGNEINKKLAKFGDRSVRHRFVPKYPSTEVMVREVFKCGHMGLEKNTFSHYRNMRSIFLLMNETFLEALSEEQQEKLQNLIRGIPNHLWLYKIRSMVYLWERYHRVLKTLDESKIHKENELKAIAREWRNPVFHWLAKQAFDELKAISGVAWPDHHELYPGLRICVKSFKVNSNEKFFINVCQAPEVPAPEDVTEEELIAILESTTPGSFRVPMSISEPRHTKDRSDKTVDVCDIAINPRFLVKIQKSQLFNNFFLQIVAEAMSEKYNVQLNMQKTITLNNRKFIGTLVSHRVRNDDVKKAQPGSQAAITGQDQAAVSPDKSGKLVQEINEKDAAAIRKIRSSAGGGQELQYKLRARVRDETVDEIHAEIYLPNCVSSQEVNLDIGEDRILVESHKHGYVFDKFVNYRLQQDRAQALFDKTSKMLQIRIPVLIN